MLVPSVMLTSRNFSGGYECTSLRPGVVCARAWQESPAAERHTGGHASTSVGDHGQRPVGHLAECYGLHARGLWIVSSDQGSGGCDRESEEFRCPGRGTPEEQDVADLDKRKNSCSSSLMQAHTSSSTI